jgi:hypothetical protein
VAKRSISAAPKIMSMPPTWPHDLVAPLRGSALLHCARLEARHPPGARAAFASCPDAVAGVGWHRNG